MAAKDVKFGNDARIKMLEGVTFWRTQLKLHWARKAVT
jgi:hypothetical protein